MLSLLKNSFSSVIEKIQHLRDAQNYLPKRRKSLTISLRRHCKARRGKMFEESDEQFMPISRTVPIPCQCLSLSSSLLQPSFTAFFTHHSVTHHSSQKTPSPSLESPWHSLSNCHGQYPPRRDLQRRIVRRISLVIDSDIQRPILVAGIAEQGRQKVMKFLGKYELPNSFAIVPYYRPHRTK